MTENPDNAVLRAALGADPDAYLRGQVRAGATPETIIEDVATRSRGLVRLSRTSLDTLTQDALAAAGPSQSEIDAATIEAAVGMPVGPYLRQKIAEGKSVAHVRAQVSESSGVALPFSRIVDLINEERAAHGPYMELKRTNSSHEAGEPEIASAFRPTRSRSQAPTKGAGARSGASAPARRSRRPRPEPARDTKKWLSKLDLDLAKSLHEPTGEFILKHAKIGTANGLKEPQVFQHVASRLIAQGARRDLTPQDVERLLRRHGWRTLADRKAASAKRAAPAWKPEGYRPDRGGSSGARGGFWAGIANERYVRPVSGGLPSLGKRS